MTSALFAAHALVLAAVIIKTRPWLTGDSVRYMALSEALIDGREFGLRVGDGFEPEGMRMPGYPLFIAVCCILLGRSAFSVVIAQSILFLASAWLFWRTTKEVFGERAALTFLALSSIYPFIAYSAGQVSPEMPTVFLLASSFYCLAKGRLHHYLLTGLLIGAASYFRPNLILLAVVVGIACILANRRGYQKALLIIAASIITVLPWCFRNYYTFGVFIPTSTIKGTGLSLFLATCQSKISIPSLIEYGMRGRVTEEMAGSGVLEQIRGVNRSVGVPEETIFVTLESYPDNAKKMKADELFTQAAMANIKASPLTYLRSAAWNMLRMWFSGNSAGNFPFIVKGLLMLEGIVILVLGIAGIVVVLRNDTRDGNRAWVYIAIGSLIYFSITLCWLHTEARYTIPVRFILLVFAGCALRALVEFVRSGESKKSLLKWG